MCSLWGQRGVAALDGDDAQCADGPEESGIATGVSAGTAEAAAASDLLLTGRADLSRAATVGAGVGGSLGVAALDRVDQRA